MAKIDTSVIVSSRIRLARNIEGYLFPVLLKNTKEEKFLVSMVTSLFSRLGEYDVLNMNNLSQTKVDSLIERYLISPVLAKNLQGAVCISGDKSLSIMVMEEDHLREQCFVNGLDLVGAYKKIMGLDQFLARNVRFCKKGNVYLTACPSNLGSGMRASVMMFLPALCYTGEIDYVFELAQTKNITIRGAFGEGSQAEGFWFQVSNGITLLAPQDILQLVNDFSLTVVNLEKRARDELFETHKDEFIDKCLRAYGILQNSYLLSYEECCQLIARVKLGNSLGFLPLKNPNALDDLLVTVRPNTLKLVKGDQRDEYLVRAEYVKEAFKII